MTFRKIFTSAAFIFLLGAETFAEITFNTVQDIGNFYIQNSSSIIQKKEILLLGIQSSRLEISSFLPEFALSWGQSEQIVKSGADSRSKTIDFSVMQKIFNGGKDILSYRQQIFNAECELENFLEETKNARIEIMKSYYDYVADIASAEIQKSILENAENQYKLLLKLYELGLAIENDVIEFNASLMQMKNSLKQDEREIRRKKRCLYKNLQLNENESVNFPETDFSEARISELCILLEPYEAPLWNIVKSNSKVLSQKRQTLNFLFRQLKASEKSYLPKISVGVNVSFSGDTYPLTEPSVSIKTHISFPDSRLLPDTISASTIIKQNQLAGDSFSSDKSCTPDLTKSFARKTSVLNLISEINSVKELETELYENFLSLIGEHDDYADKVIYLREYLELLEKKDEISRTKLHNGELRHVDYLEELQTLAQTKAELITTLYSLECSLCILNETLGFNEGGLENECKKSE